ncbi:MAG: LysE family transporter [Thermoflexales bacterium]|nr:LysE family transporter [Thermoflexales bacterium]
MPLLLFLLEAGLISLSGVMSPGPMTTVIVGKGSQSPHAGALVSLGHSVVEIPLMIAVLYGAGRLLGLPYVKFAIALVGGLFLLVMGAGMFRSTRPEEPVPRDVRGERTSPVMAGIALSAGNPYFLVWWATVGVALVLRSIDFGWSGFVAFAVLHSLCDLVWATILSALSFTGGRFLGQGFQRAVSLVCGVLLVFFGGKLIIDSASFFI